MWRSVCRGRPAERGVSLDEGDRSSDAESASPGWASRTTSNGVINRRRGGSGPPVAFIHRAETLRAIPKEDNVEITRLDQLRLMRACEARRKAVSAYGDAMRAYASRPVIERIAGHLSQNRRRPVSRTRAVRPCGTMIRPEDVGKMVTIYLIATAAAK